MRFEWRRTTFCGRQIRSLHTGAGPAVVLLHGLGGSHRWWRFTIPALAGGYRVHVPEVVALDRGHATGRPPSIGAAAEFIAGWLDAIGVEQTHLIGHSMGGQIAIHMAARWPDRVMRLVLANAAGIPRELSPGAFAQFLIEMLPPRAWGKLTFIPTVALDALRTGPRSLWRTVRHILADDVRPLLPAIRSPTLVVWGARDALTPLRYGRVMAERIPDARLVVIPSAAHNSMADRPAAFNGAVRSFLDEAR